ncbi:MAG TPA: hypothetical protein VHF27_14225 [Acidimicrobiales bacterium]|nr:hypothetical protein [Acidimicrobiales bacterium]
MAAVGLLIVLALLFWGFVLLVEGIVWALIVALLLMVFSAAAGFRGGGVRYRSRRAGPTRS